MDEGRDGRREIERNVENFCLSVWVKSHEASRPLQKITTAGEKQSWGHGWTGDGGCGGMLYEGQWASRTKIKRRTYLQNRGEERAVCLRVCASQPEGVWQEWQLDLRKGILPDATGLHSHSTVYTLKAISLLLSPVSFSCRHLFSLASPLSFSHSFSHSPCLSPLHLSLSNELLWGGSICSISSWSLAEGNKTLLIYCVPIIAQHKHAENSRQTL